MRQGGAAAANNRGGKGAGRTQAQRSDAPSGRRQQNWCTTDAVSTLLSHSGGAADVAHDGRHFDPVTKSFCDANATCAALDVMLARLRRLVLANWEKKVGRQEAGLTSHACLPRAETTTHTSCFM
jgi:hypothetical protein